MHRIGRTARGNKTGIALSFVDDGDAEALDVIVQRQSKVSFRGAPECWLTPILQVGCKISECDVKLSDLEALRYRVDDVLQKVRVGVSGFPLIV